MIGLLFAGCGGGSVGDGAGGASGSGGAAGGAPGGGSGGAITAGGSGGATTEGSGGAPGGDGTGGAMVTPDGGSGGARSDDGGTGGAPPSGGTKVVMYLPNWAGSFSSWAGKMDFKKMTHLNLAFGTVSAGTNNWSLGASDADVMALVSAAHAAHVKVLVSIGGADADIGIITRYQTASNIDPLVANLDSFIARLGLDGVDVDLERGALMKSSGNFPAFVAKLVSTLRPKGKLVTSALAQYIVEDAGSDATITTWLKSYDFINLMIYSTNMATYTSELNWWSTTKGIPKANLVWGIEFSSRLTTAMAKQLTTASEAYGGVMVWEYSQGTEATLWPAVQGAL